MLSQPQTELATRRVPAASSTPSTVVWIGSYVLNDADAGSGFDLIVLQKELASKSEEYLRLMAEVHRVMHGVDLILMREDDFEWKCQVGGTLPYRAKKERRVPHDFQ